MRLALPGEVDDPDARMTPIGRVLRRFRIDEPPQAWNILRGEMSLIGPRPQVPTLAAEYARSIPAYAFRRILKPGITGWAQVCCGYASTAAETRHKLSCDLYYVKYASFLLDLRILRLTVRVLISNRRTGQLPTLPQR